MANNSNNDDDTNALLIALLGRETAKKVEYQFNITPLPSIYQSIMKNLPWGLRDNKLSGPMLVAMAVLVLVTGVGVMFLSAPLPQPLPAFAQGVTLEPGKNIVLNAPVMDEQDIPNYQFRNDPEKGVVFLWDAIPSCQIQAIEGTPDSNMNCKGVTIFILKGYGTYKPGNPLIIDLVDYPARTF